MRRAGARGPTSLRFATTPSSFLACSVSDLRAASVSLSLASAAWILVASWPSRSAAFPDSASFAFAAATSFSACADCDPHVA